MKYTEIGKSTNNGSTVPGGKYLVQVTEAKEAESKSGVPMLKVRCQIVEGDHKGRYLYDQLSSNCRRPKSFGRALGLINGTEKEFELDPERVINRLVYVKVETEVYDGITRSKVAFDGYSPVGLEKTKTVLGQLRVEKDKEEEEEVSLSVEDVKELEKFYAEYSL